MLNLSHYIIILKIILCNSQQYRFIYSLISNGILSPQYLNSTLKNDLLGNIWERENFLLDIGIRSQFLLGKRNRERYKTFLFFEYLPSELNIFSFNFVNNLLSTQSFLNGLYQNGPQLNNWGKNISKSTYYYNYYGTFDINQNSSLPNQIQLFPINIKSNKNLDFFYIFNKSECNPFFINILEENKNSLIIKNTFNNFINNWGKTIKNYYPEIILNNFDDLYSFSKSYLSNFYNGNNISINDNLFFEDLYRIIDIYYFDYVNGDDTRMFSKFLLNSIWPSIKIGIKNRIFKDTNSTATYSIDFPKMILFSIDELHIATFFKLLNETFNLNITDYKSSSVKFSSSLNFEIMRSSQNYLIYLLLNDNKYGPFSLDYFFNSIDNKVLSNFQIKNFCTDKEDKVLYIYKVASSILGGICLIFLILSAITLLICLIFYEKREKRKDKHVKIDLNTPKTDLRNDVIKLRNI